MTGRQHDGVATDASCYLLEFSVGPGGARLGDVHAYPDLVGLREGFERRCDWRGEDGVDPYLVMWYGAELTLWVVQHGEIVEGIDLHPFLRSADPRYDATLQEVLDDQDEDWRELFDLVVEAYLDRTAAQLPLLARLRAVRAREAAGDEAAADELQEMIDELDAAREEAADPEESEADGANELRLDWDAVATAAPPLQGSPARGRFEVRWSPAFPRHNSSYLGAGRTLHLGVNDLENFDHEYAHPPGLPA